MISKIKEKLEATLTNSINELTEEDLVFIENFKNHNLLSKLKELFQFNNVKNINLLNTAIMLITNDERLKEKYQQKNRKIFHSLFQIDNHLIFRKAMKMFFESKENVKKLNSIKQLESFDFSMENKEISVLLSTKEPKKFINPYTSAIFELNIAVDNESSRILIENFLDDKIVNSKVFLNQYVPCEAALYKESTHSGMMDTFKLKDICNFFTEYVLFHELSHGAVKKNYRMPYITNGIFEESSADICGILKVIKNNDLNKEDSIKFVNRIIGFRSMTGIEHYLEDDSFRKHFTQIHLTLLRSFLKNEFEFVKSIGNDEELSFAELINAMPVDKFINSDISENVVLHIISYNEQVQKGLNKTSDELYTLLSANKLNNIALTDLLFNFYYIEEKFEDLYSFSPLSYSSTLFMIEKIKKEIEGYREDIHLMDGFNKNFSKKEVEGIIEKEKNKLKKI